MGTDRKPSAKHHRQQCTERRYPAVSVCIPPYWHALATSLVGGRSQPQLLRVSRTGIIRHLNRLSAGGTDRLKDDLSALCRLAFLVSVHLARALDPETVQILQLDAMTSNGTYPTPIPFGGMGKPVNTNGYSDHYPITIKITEPD